MVPFRACAPYRQWIFVVQCSVAHGAEMAETAVSTIMKLAMKIYERAQTSSNNTKDCLQLSRWVSTPAQYLSTLGDRHATAMGCVATGTLLAIRH
jgi:hypothetical protein